MFSRRFSRVHNKGFTLIEVLFSLMITLIIVMNCATIIKFVYSSQNVKVIDSKIQNSMKLLSQNITTGYQFTYGPTLTFKNEKDEDIEIYLDSKKRLIMTPGHYIYCQNLENVRFYNQNHLIYITFKMNAIQYTYLIGSDYDESEGNSTTSYTDDASHYYF